MDFAYSLITCNAVNIIGGSKQFKIAFQPEQTKPTNRTEAMKLIVFSLLVLLLGNVSSTPLLMLPRCPEGKILNTLWQRCENLPQTDQNIDQPTLAKINEGSLIGGPTTGCMAGCKYSSRLGECVCCNKEERLYWSEYMGKCVKVY